MKRDFKRLLDITAEECRHLLDRARFLKEAAPGPQGACAA